MTGYIPRSFRYFSEELQLSVNTITKIWQRFLQVSINPRAKGGTRWNKLSEDNLELTELLKNEKASVSLAKIISCLEENGRCGCVNGCSFKGAQAENTIGSLHKTFHKLKNIGKISK